MASDPDPALSHLCPHVERNDPRCQARFRMGELDAMYRYCTGGFYGCVLYHRINREAHYRAPQGMTIHGRTPIQHGQARTG